MAGEGKNVAKAAVTAKESSPVVVAAATPPTDPNQPTSEVAALPAAPLPVMAAAPLPAAPPADEPAAEDAEDIWPDPAPPKAPQLVPDGEMGIRVREDGFALLEGGRIHFTKGREFAAWDYDWRKMVQQGVKLDGVFYENGVEMAPLDLNVWVTLQTGG